MGFPYLRHPCPRNPCFRNSHRWNPCFRNSHLRNCIREEKGTQTSTFWSGYFRLGRGLPREGVGAKKFGMSLETREIKLFWRDIPGFCRDVPEVPEKFEKKSLCSIFVPYCRRIQAPLNQTPLRRPPINGRRDRNCGGLRIISSNQRSRAAITVGVKIISGGLVTLENLFQ